MSGIQLRHSNVIAICSFSIERFHNAITFLLRTWPGHCHTDLLLPTPGRTPLAVHALLSLQQTGRRS